MIEENQYQELDWGETPWDNLSRDELLREVQRMYQTISELTSVVEMIRVNDLMRAGLSHDSEEPPNPYWSKDGVGGKVLEMARQIIDPLNKTYGTSNIYRAFFRYANDLLFESNGFSMIGGNWMICPECGQMIGNKYEDISGLPCSSKPFGKKGCQGVFRKLEWPDLAKKDKEVDEGN